MNVYLCRLYIFLTHIGLLFNTGLYFKYLAYIPQDNSIVPVVTVGDVVVTALTVLTVGVVNGVDEGVL